MSRVLPILFNIDMVRAILDGQKTVTRRVVKQPYYVEGDENDKRTLIAVRTAPKGSKLARQIGNMPYPDAPYKIGDILYVRETWRRLSTHPNAGYEYAADWSPKYFDNSRRPEAGNNGKWHPSIHMPKEAARIWLKVTDVRVERLQDITEEQAQMEGCNSGLLTGPCTARGQFENLWNSTIKKSDLDRYG